MANCNHEPEANFIENSGNHLENANLNFEVVEKYGRSYAFSGYHEWYGWFRLLLAAENGDLQS
jgi:hypothetical protein